MSWELWSDIHGLPEQLKRQVSAKKVECTPLEISGNSGKFQGQSGRYVTTLESCQCGDFIRRRKPCKHMYRLAMELGIFGGKDSLVSDKSKVIIPRNERPFILQDIIGILENYPDNLQVIFKEILCDLTYRNQKLSYVEDRALISDFYSESLLVDSPDYSFITKSYGKRKTSQLLREHPLPFPKDCTQITKQYNWFLAHASEYGPQIFENETSVVLSPELRSCATDVYKYLHRKFDKDGYYDSDTDETVSCPAGSIGVLTVHVSPFEIASESHREFPNDAATKMLDLFDTNPTKESK